MIMNVLIQINLNHSWHNIDLTYKGINTESERIDNGFVKIQITKSAQSKENPLLEFPVLEDK
jgi:hypothetical protein